MIGSILGAILLLWAVAANGQTHTMPGSNVVPSGASLTIQSGGTITASPGSTVTGFGGGGGAPTTVPYLTATSDGTLTNEVNLGALGTGLLKGTVSAGTSTISAITDNSTNWNTAFTQTRQWDGGATGLVAATGRTSLALVPGTNVEVPLTFSTGLTRSTNTVTVNTSQNIATLSNLTTNGFVKTGGAVGTLSVDTATYQPSDADLTTWAGLTPSANFQSMVPHTFAQMQTDLGLVIGTNVQAFDADLTTWAGITPGTNVGTFLATPSSANLRAALTDENGTGAALFSGATTPDFTTGFTVGAAAASGKILKGNGTNFVPSTETYASPGTSGNVMVSDGTNWTSATGRAEVYTNGSAAGLTTCCAANTIIPGSTITIPAGTWKANGSYRCTFDMVKTAAGVAAMIVNIHMGTLGTTSDAIVYTATFPFAGTAATDTGIFDVFVTFKSVGSGTSAVIYPVVRLLKGNTTTGFTNTPTIMATAGGTASAGFNSTTQTKISIGFNGGTSFSGTNAFTQTEYTQ
jgi:hypothetical protein